MITVLFKILLIVILVRHPYAEDFWIAILCYHRVLPVPELEFDVSVKDFDIQMNYIKENYKIISLNDLMEHMDLKEPFYVNTIIVTFDDGDKSIYKYAYPVMKKYKISFTVFLYTDVTKENRGLSWDEIIEMSADGVEFGSHSVTHHYLTKKEKNETQSVYKKRVKTELKDSKKIIEEKTGKPVKYFAYPYGRFNEFVEKEAVSAGYKAILLAIWDKNNLDSNRYRLKRRLVPKNYTFDKFVNIFKSIKTEDQNVH